MAQEFFDETMWRQGATLASYVANMASKREEMERRLATVALAEEDRRFFSRIKAALRVVVMTEDWCGDSLMCLPILARIVEAIPDAEMRIFRRDHAPLLAAHYASRDIRNIPVFTFMDDSFRETGSWVERAAAAHQRRRQWVDENPEIQAILGQDLPPDQKRELLKVEMAGMTALLEGWYENGLQRATVDELRKVING